MLYLAVALLVVVSVGGLSLPQQHVEHGVMFDAGSTGTRVRIYSYTWDNSVPLGIKNMVQVSSMKVRPGLSSLLNNVSGIQNYLQPLMDMASSSVPKAQQAETPILFMATAGMRFEPQDESEKVLDEVRRLFRHPSFNPFNYTQPNVQVLSGEEEGVYAWVALNYILGYFDSIKPVNETAGIMEMGGGSTQIAFIPEDQPYEGEYSVILAKRKFDLYVHSYLNYGTNGIQRQVAEELVRIQEPDNPCVLKGDSKSFLLQNGSYVQMNGTGEPNFCELLLWPLIEPEYGIECEPKPCAIKNQYMPELPSIPFYALQGFAYAAKDLGVLGEESSLDLRKMLENGTEYCRQTLQEAIAAGASLEYASQNCLISLYTPLLLEGVYNVREVNQLKAPLDINGRRIEWAMGALIVDISEMKTGIYSAVSPRRRR